MAGERIWPKSTWDSKNASEVLAFSAHAWRNLVSRLDSR
jgi:hypothetical protein